MVPIEIQAKFKALFLTAVYSEVTAGKIDEAIREVSTKTRDGCIHFGLDDKFMIEHAGHYLIHGSEYLMVLSVRLGGPQQDLTKNLQKIGIPTVFICDIPIERVPDYALRDLSGTIIEAIFESIIFKKPIPLSIDFAITLRDVVEPECIVGHYHPEEVPNPHDSYRIYRWKDDLNLRE